MAGRPKRKDQAKRLENQRRHREGQQFKNGMLKNGEPPKKLVRKAMNPNPPKRTPESTPAPSANGNGSGVGFAPFVDQEFDPEIWKWRVEEAKELGLWFGSMMDPRSGADPNARLSDAERDRRREALVKAGFYIHEGPGSYKWNRFYEKRAAESSASGRHQT